MSVCTTVVSTRSFAPSSRPRSTAASTTRSLTTLSVSGVSRTKARWKALCFGYRPAVEAGELAQRVAVGDPFTQLAIVPVLDPHQDQRAQHLLRRQPAASRVGLLQPPPQIATDIQDQVCVIIEKVGDRLQQRLQHQPLPHQFPVGKADLKAGRSRHGSAPLPRGSLRPLALQSLDVAWRRLVQQLLNSAPIVQAAAYLRHKLLRHVHRKTPPLQAAIQNIARMSLARLARRAALANAGTAPQAQRTENRRPCFRRLTRKPAHNIAGGFVLTHAVRMPSTTHTRQAKMRGKKVAAMPIFTGYFAFRDRN